MNWRVACCVAALLCLGAGDDDPPISPRLPMNATAKGLGTMAVQIWMKPDSPPPPGAMPLGDDLYLADYTAAQVEQLAQSGMVDYIAPADGFAAPATEGGEEPGEDGAKALVLWPEGTGRGVTVGIIDFGPAPALAAIEERRDFGIPGRGDHFEQVVGIVNRLAPDARLITASLPAAQASASDVARAALWLAERGARVISFSGATYTNRRDGLAPLDRLVDRLAARGILWIAAAGNEAQRSWTGWSEDRDGDGAVDGAPLVHVSGGAVELALTWDDWGGDAAPQGVWDLDLVLRDGAGRIVGATRIKRGRRGEPVEVLNLRDVTPGDYRAELPMRGTGAPVRVRLVATGAVDYVTPVTPAGSIGSPATARGAVAVGAVEQPGYSTARYSGQGPTADHRPKPDLASLGNNAGGGGWRFGTSYAAPRVAAMAACLMEGHPAWTPAQIRTRLSTYARPVAARRSTVGEAAGWIDSRGRDRR